MVLTVGEPELVPLGDDMACTIGTGADVLTLAGGFAVPSSGGGAIAWTVPGSGGGASAWTVPGPGGAAFALTGGVGAPPLTVELGGKEPAPAGGLPAAGGVALLAGGGGAGGSVDACTIPALFGGAGGVLGAGAGGSDGDDGAGGLGGGVTGVGGVDVVAACAARA